MEYITLNDGYKIPQVGLGVYKVTDAAECERAVLAALKAGYRLIDTAEAYGNEEAVGNAIRKSGIPREEIFLTTKVHFMWADDAERQLRESLRKLQTPYIDLVLLHWPYGNYYHAYRVMEKLQKEGLIRSIGVSNFDPARVVDLIHFNEVVPAVNQIEAHLYCQRGKDAAFLQERGIVLEAYSPLGRGDAGMMTEPEVLELAGKYGKTPAQILLRYLLQLGYVIIPKSVHENRIKENIDLFDFALSEEEMAALALLNRDKAVSGRAEDLDRALHLIERK